MTPATRARLQELEQELRAFNVEFHARDGIRAQHVKWATALAACLAAEGEPTESEAPNLNQWTCFHCGETFTTYGGARDHFGAVEGADPGCLVDRVALEEGGKPERGRGLLMALRKAEDRIAELVREVDSVENDARLWHESEGERRRLQKGHDTSWFMYLDSLEGERLVLAERVSALEARLAAEGEEEPLATVRWEDLKDVMCLLVEYVDCPEVWSDTIGRFEQALGMTHAQLKARSKGE